MNGVEVLDVSSVNMETYISNMPVDENVVSADESAMESVGGIKEDGNNNVNEPQTPQDLEKLKLALQQQLEYYFSSENLTRDQYLVSQMDDQHYVPIWTIANFNLVKNLTTDIDLITDVLRASSLVQVDDKNEKVRPNQTKYALILREIPGATPVEDVEALFNGEECPKFISCEFAANTSWYVTFETESDAQDAYRHLREKVKTFLGRPIMARIKSRTHHLSTYSSSKISNINQQKVQQPTMPGQIVSPSYIQSPMNVFPQPGPPYAQAAGGQQPPFIAAIATQPPGSTSPHSSSVSTTAAPAQVYVMPPGGQPWSPFLNHPPDMPFANQAFGNAVYHPVPQQPVAPNFMGGPGKRNAMYNGKGYMNNNYISGEMHGGRNMQQDNQIMQLQPMNPSTPDSRPHYLPAVPHAQMPIKMQMNGQQNMYQSPPVIQGQYYGKNPPPMNKPNGKQGGNMSMANNGGRFNRNSYNNSYHSQHDNDVSPRFQKKGMQPSHQHQRYSTSRSNANNQSQDYTRHNSENGLLYQNGPHGNMSLEAYPPPFLARNNSTGHDGNSMNGSRYGPRQGGYGGKHQDSMEGSSGAYNVSDINNNSAKRQNFNNDTVPSGVYNDINSRGGRQRKPRRNGESYGIPGKVSPPEPMNGPVLPEQSFNLESTSFPPLPGPASNVDTNPIATAADSVVKKPQVPESYKKTLKMNLDKVPQCVSPPSMTTTTTITTTTVQQPTSLSSSISTTTSAIVSRSHPVAKEETMQSAAKEQISKKVNDQDNFPNTTTTATTAPTPQQHHHHHHHHHSQHHGKSPAKSQKQNEAARHQTHTGDNQQNTGHEKSTKSNHRHHGKSHNNKSTAETKGKSEPQKFNTSEKNTVPITAEPGKKLSYAEMLQKKSAKRNPPIVQDENENHIDAKQTDSAEEKSNTTPTAPAPHRAVEKVQGSQIDDSNKQHEEKSTSPTEDNDNEDDKPWESATHTKRSHRSDRNSSDHSHQNGYDSRNGGYQRNGNRGGGFYPRNQGMRGKGRGRGGGYGRGGSRYGYNGRDRYNSAGSERSVVSNGDVPQRKR
ncbi:uncharacterized protein LOC120341800 [Styela clava]